MQKILKLNRSYIAAGIAPWKEVVKNIFTESVYPLDLRFAIDSDNKVDFSVLEYFEVIKTWEDWYKLPIRPYDEFINSANSTVRLPSVVICCKYDRIVYKRGVFPTQSKIWKRDNYTCQYTGERLTKANMTVDHIIPRSKGGKDTWENLVTCKKSVNSLKSDQVLGEARFPNDPKKWGKFAGQKFKLLKNPTRPKLGCDEKIYENFREEWQHFINQ